MFAPDLRFIGFTATEYGRLLESIRPPGEASRAEPGASGGIVLVTEGRQLIKLVHTELGRLEPRDQSWPEALPDVSARTRTRWVLQMEFGALQALFERFGDELRPEHDYLAQLLLLLSLFRQYEAEGRIRLWPQALSQWPVPSQRAAQRALDAICPTGNALVFGVFQKGELYTAVAMRRMEQGFDRVIGPSLLAPKMGLLSGDWTRDYRHLLAAAQDLAGPVCLGCFAELATLQALAGSARPGAWAQAVAMREVILTPVVPVLAIPLGVDVGLAALQGVKALAERAKSVDWVTAKGPLVGMLKRVQASKRPAASLKSILGFDPLSLLYKLVEKRPHRE